MSSHRPGVTTTTLEVVGGRRSGLRLELPAGRWTIGRDVSCDVVLDDDGVSRRHALLVVDGPTVVLEDLGSRNGTWVDGTRLESPRQVQPGAEVRLGGTVIQVGTRDLGPSSPSPRPRRKVSLGRVALAGGLANLVILAAGVAIQFLTDWTGIGTWLAAPLAGMVASLVQVGKEAMTRPREEPGRAAPAGPDRGRPAGITAAAPTRSAPRRAPLGVGVLVAVLLIGGGGLAVAYGVWTVSSYLTGNQSGVEMLSQPVSRDVQGLTVTVSSVEDTRNFTRVGVSVRNDLANTVTLRVHNGNATLRAPDGSTLQADGFRSNWPDTIGPGQLSSGTIVFPGHLPAGTTSAALAFATVFEQGFDGPDSILVEGLALEPLG